MVDYTNYLILGVTVALAWELPSKPPSEILDDLTERLKDGTLGTSRNDTVENIKYVDNKLQPNNPKKYDKKYQYSVQPMFKTPMHYRYYYPYPSTDNSYKGQKDHTPLQTKAYITNEQNYWTKKNVHPLKKWIRKPADYSLAESKYPWWNLPQR